jgi:reverse gyrase
MNTPIDHNNDRWIGFHLSELDAQKALEAATVKQAKKYRIVSASKTLLAKKKGDLLMYKFAIIKTPRF